MDADGKAIPLQGKDESAKDLKIIAFPKSSAYIRCPRSSRERGARVAAFGVAQA
jgi:hypothetical protein